MAAVASFLIALSLGLGLSREPYVGVACHGADNTSCGRVGIAVWVARPGATRVDANLAGVHVRLAPPKTPASFWVGFVRLPLRRMGLPKSWTGTPAKKLTLALRVRYPSGWRSDTLCVELRPGWG